MSFSSLAQAQYYATALGLTGNPLKTKLHDIIKGHNQQTYSQLWTHYYFTDRNASNQMLDIYSNIPNGTWPYVYIYSTDQCGNAQNHEHSCYNREHTWPATFFNDFYPMYSDLFHVMPSDAYVNNKRNNFPYGKVNTIVDTFLNGTKLGKGNTYSNYISTNPNHWEFEPIDSFKGDIARNYFYMSTRYMGEDASWYNWEMANGADLTPEAITLLLSWHHLDPVSQKEIDRNNAIYSIQGNRNPFIDYPQFVDCIWGNSDCTYLPVKDIKIATLKIYPNPVQDVLQIEGLQEKINRKCVYSVDGRMVKQIYDSESTVDLQNLSTGIYYLEVATDKTIYRQTFSKR
ncbi:MAG: endonuclease [Chitinophagaceae bacterium]